MIAKVFFAYFAAAIIVLSILTVTRRNPVHSILNMLLMFFHIAGLYLFLNAEFLAAIQIIVYAGAILVLFLFVVMMLDLKEEILGRKFAKGWLSGLAISGLIFYLLVSSLKSVPLGPRGVFTPEAVAAETNTGAIGRLMYTEYVFPFEVASVILLVAIVGAIVLAKKRTADE